MSGPRGEQCRLCYYHTREMWPDMQDQHAACAITNINSRMHHDNEWCGQFKTHPRRSRWKYPKSSSAQEDIDPHPTVEEIGDEGRCLSPYSHRECKNCVEWEKYHKNRVGCMIFESRPSPYIPYMGNGCKNYKPIPEDEIGKEV